MSRGFGVIRLGDVTAYGEWNAYDGQMEVSFETRSLSLRVQDELDHYKAPSREVKLQLPRDAAAERAVVTGFRDSGRKMTFILKRQCDCAVPGLDE
jgi:hypothetical protein